MIAGTVHSFQGTEADVVIFDLVIDEPHWRANLFWPKVDEQIKRMMNVALTRAKFRLIVIGDFNYCLARGKKSFLGKTLLPFLLGSYPKIDAAQLLPEGLAARAADAQITAIGGEVELDSERILTTQTNYYRFLISDFNNACKRIIIYSAFLTKNRMTFLLPALHGALSRSVEVFLITKSHSERSAKEIQNIRTIENQLTEIGVVVIHKMGSHEKLIFIDDDILWVGSLNTLSQRDSQEIMGRRKNRNVYLDYIKTLRLQELLEVQGNPESKCPICDSEMIASEGADQPFYWRCVNDKCYTRSIDQPYPFDGVLKCHNCNASLSFGYWGESPYWRCDENTRHRQRIYKSHLRLPKMVKLIPKKEHRKICRLYSLNSLTELIRSDQCNNTDILQKTLFD